MMNVVASDELADKEFPEITLREPYGSLTGPIERKAGIYVWGPEGSGKSTFALGLARALVKHALANGGTVLYASREEGPDKKVRDRAQRIGATHPALLISDFSTPDELEDAMDEYGVQFLVIDSVSALSLRSKKAQDLIKKIRERGIGLIAVSHANAKGQPKGETYLPHMMDVVIHCYAIEGERGKVHVAETTKNRYAELTAMEIPMTVDQVGEDITMDEAQRENPDCSETPQTDQCKAIFARLTESGEYDPSIPKSSDEQDEKNTREGKEDETVPLVEDQAPEVGNESRSVAIAKSRPDVPPNTVVQEARDVEGRLLGYLTASHDGSPGDVRRAADDLRDEAILRWPDWSNVNSRTGFTDQDGDPFVISPNREHIAPAGSTEAQAMMGDEEAIRQLFGTKAAPKRDKPDAEPDADPEEPEGTMSTAEAKSALDDIKQLLQDALTA